MSDDPNPFHAGFARALQDRGGPPPAQTVLAVAVVLRWLALWGALPAVVAWTLLDLHSIASDVRDLRHDLKFLRATYEGRKAACEEMQR